MLSCGGRIDVGKSKESGRGGEEKVVIDRFLYMYNIFRSLLIVL